jgi:hypothetical protein
MILNTESAGYNVWWPFTGLKFLCECKPLHLRWQLKAEGEDTGRLLWMAAIFFSVESKAGSRPVCFYAGRKQGWFLVSPMRYSPYQSVYFVRS